VEVCLCYVHDPRGETVRVLQVSFGWIQSSPRRDPCRLREWYLLITRVIADAYDILACLWGSFSSRSRQALAARLCKELGLEV
jgi:hypothetical protein